MKTNSMIMKCCLVLGMVMVSALGMQAQKVLMNIHKTDGTILSINTEEVKDVTFEEKYASATVYYGCTDDIPTSIAGQGTAVDIWGDADDLTFQAKGGCCAWVAVPKYWKVGDFRFGIANLSLETVQVGGYIVFYCKNGNGDPLNYTFTTHIQKTNTPVTPSSVLIYYGSSSTVPNTTSEMTSYQVNFPTTVTIDGSGSKCVYVAFNPENANIESIKQEALGSRVEILDQFEEDGLMTGYKNVNGYKVYYIYHPTQTLTYPYIIKLVKNE